MEFSLWFIHTMAGDEAIFFSCTFIRSMWEVEEEVETNKGSSIFFHLNRWIIKKMKEVNILLRNKYEIIF